MEAEKSRGQENFQARPLRRNYIGSERRIFHPARPFVRRNREGGQPRALFLIHPSSLLLQIINGQFAASAADCIVSLFSLSLRLPRHPLFLSPFRPSHPLFLSICLYSNRLASSLSSSSSSFSRKFVKGCANGLTSVVLEIYPPLSFFVYFSQKKSPMTRVSTSFAIECVSKIGKVAPLFFGNLKISRIIS